MDPAAAQRDLWLENLPPQRPLFPWEWGEPQMPREWDAYLRVRFHLSEGARPLKIPPTELFPGSTVLMEAYVFIDPAYPGSAPLFLMRGDRQPVAWGKPSELPLPPQLGGFVALWKRSVEAAGWDAGTLAAFRSAPRVREGGLPRGWAAPFTMAKVVESVAADAAAAIFNPLVVQGVELREQVRILCRTQFLASLIESHSLCQQIKAELLVSQLTSGLAMAGVTLLVRPPRPLLLGVITQTGDQEKEGRAGAGGGRGGREGPDVPVLPDLRPLDPDRIYPVHPSDLAEVFYTFQHGGYLERDLVKDEENSAMWQEGIFVPPEACSGDRLQPHHHANWVQRYHPTLAEPTLHRHQTVREAHRIVYDDPGNERLRFAAEVGPVPLGHKNPTADYMIGVFPVPCAPMIDVVRWGSKEWPQAVLLNAACRATVAIFRHGHGALDIIGQNIEKLRAAIVGLPPVLWGAASEDWFLGFISDESREKWHA